jgi:Mn2+/Fe2+ NRAMP family transporter
MAGKTLQADSKYAQFDADGDGIVTDEEMARAEKMIQIENDDKKEDAQRGMAWFALFGMLLYPFAVVGANFIGLVSAGNILGDMAPTYFVSVAAIVAAFYAKEGYTKGK